jgi:ferredoxin
MIALVSKDKSPPVSAARHYLSSRRAKSRQANQIEPTGEGRARQTRRRCPGLAGAMCAAAVQAAFHSAETKKQLQSAHGTVVCGDGGGNTYGRSSKYFVDDQCIDCDLCRETAPANFKRNDDGGHSYVYKQPETPEEEALCKEAQEGCPVEAIGDDGE